MSSGTDACINMCLSLYGLKRKYTETSIMPGDNIIVPGLSFIATANAVCAAGFQPNMVDIKCETLNIDPMLIEESITDRTVAIMPVHTMGKPADMHQICEIATRHGLWVLEDACEAHGAKYDNKFIGHWGDMAAFSFYTAHLICCAEGGMVSTNNSEVNRILNSTRSHGRRDGGLFFDFEFPGYNSKMNDLEASLGLEGIANWNETWNKRKASWSVINNVLEKYASEYAYLSLEDSIETVSPHGVSITLKPNSKYTIKGLQQFLTEKDIHWKRNFGCTAEHAAFNDYNRAMYIGDKQDTIGLSSLSNSHWVGNNGLHIGCHAYLSMVDVNYICDSFIEFFTK